MMTFIVLRSRLFRFSFFQSRRTTTCYSVYYPHIGYKGVSINTIGRYYIVLAQFCMFLLRYDARDMMTFIVLMSRLFRFSFFQSRRTTTCYSVCKMKKKLKGGYEGENRARFHNLGKTENFISNCDLANFWILNRNAALDGWQCMLWVESIADELCLWCVWTVFLFRISIL